MKFKILKVKSPNSVNITYKHLTIRNGTTFYLLDLFRNLNQ